MDIVNDLIKQEHHHREPSNALVAMTESRNPGNSSFSNKQYNPGTPNKQYNPGTPEMRGRHRGQMDNMDSYMSPNGHTYMYGDDGARDSEDDSFLAEVMNDNDGGERDDMMTVMDDDQTFMGEGNQSKRMMQDARRALKSSGGHANLVKYLLKRVEGLFLASGDPMPKGEDVQALIVSGWIEELLRFLVIKTIAGDTTFPYEMAPSLPINDAWKALMIMPSAYSKLCLAIGNDGVIDHDPFWDEDDDNKDYEFKSKHINITKRAYQDLFDQEPAKLYWALPRESTGDKLMKMFRTSSMGSGVKLHKWASMFSSSCQSPGGYS